MIKRVKPCLSTCTTHQSWRVGLHLTMHFIMQSYDGIWRIDPSSNSFLFFFSLFLCILLLHIVIILKLKGPFIIKHEGPNSIITFSFQKRYEIVLIWDRVHKVTQKQNVFSTKNLKTMKQARQDTISLSPEMKKEIC